MGLGIVIVLGVIAFCLCIILLIWKMLSKDSLHYDMKFLWSQQKSDDHHSHHSS